MFQTGECIGLFVRSSTVKPTQIIRFVLILAVVALVTIPVSCAEKMPGELSPVILARQRNLGFMFNLKSPGESLNPDEMRAFVDEIQDRIKAFYKPHTLEEFQVETASGVIDPVDIAYSAAMAGYDDVYLLEGDVSPSGFEGRLRIINAAGGGPVFDETVSSGLASAASAAAGAWNVLRPIFIEKYNNPNDFQRLETRADERMEGVENLANTLVVKAGITSVSQFQEIKSRAEMDDVYRHLKYSQELYTKIQNAYVSRDIRAKDRSDTERIQTLAGRIRALQEITSYYDEEVAVTAKDFKVTFDFQGVNDSFQQYFKTALEKSGFEKTIRLYTNKPATISVVYDVANDVGTIFLKIRYSNRKFVSWLKGKKLTLEDTRVLPLSFFNKLMADFFKYKLIGISSAGEFDRKSMSRFSLVMELQRTLYGYAQIPVAVYEGKLRPVNSMKIKLCDYPPTDVATSKPNFTQQHKLYALGTPENVAGQRLPYASVYEFFELDSLFDVKYPKACNVGTSKDLYFDVGTGVNEKVSLP